MPFSARGKKLTIATIRLMIPGPLNDDRYRMVEDEFLQTAQRFTIHLHRAEYNRLKAAAKNRSVDALREIEGLVVALPTASATGRRGAARRDAKQQQAPQMGGSAVDDACLPYASTTSLQGLMENPRDGPQVTLSSRPSGSKTRAAAGQVSRSLTPAWADRRPQRFDDAAQLVVESGSSALPTRPSEGSVKRPILADMGSRAKPLGQTGLPVSPSQQMPMPARRHAQRHGRGEEGGRKSSSLMSQVPYDDGHAASDNDDMFGLKAKRRRRDKSREFLRRAKSQGQGQATIKQSSDTIPSFL